MLSSIVPAIVGAASSDGVLARFLGTAATPSEADFSEAAAPGGEGGTNTAANCGYRESKEKAGTLCAAHTRHSRRDSATMRRSTGRGWATAQPITRWPCTRGRMPVCKGGGGGKLR
eukprot:1161664-Pelagomonas_calceolata.AAC.26